MRGKDETKIRLRGYALDASATYRISNHPLNPKVTLGYAYGSGDDNPNDTTNHEFRQTGLQSNESKFGGIPKFKVYGEALDPELSNLKIFTMGFGFQPAPRVSVEPQRHLQNACWNLPEMHGNQGRLGD